MGLEKWLYKIPSYFLPRFLVWLTGSADCQVELFSITGVVKEGLHGSTELFEVSSYTQPFSFNYTCLSK